jgi:hypothetical protein
MRNYAYDPLMPPANATNLRRVQRVRPYDFRRNGAVGKPTNFSWPGGIFGQPVMPGNRTGIFEDRYALPPYVAEAEVRGGPLQYTTLKPDPTLSDPIERGIRWPDGLDMGDEPAPAPAMARPSFVGPVLTIAAGMFVGWLLFGK